MATSTSLPSSSSSNTMEPPKPKRIISEHAWQKCVKMAEYARKNCKYIYIVYIHKYYIPSPILYGENFIFLFRFRYSS